MQGCHIFQFVRFLVCRIFISPCIAWSFDFFQGCQIENLKEVDRCQNQYMMLLFRYQNQAIWLCICICICTVTQLTSFCICIPIVSTSTSQHWPYWFAGTCRRSTVRRRCTATSPRSWPSSSTCWPTATNSPASASRKPSINRVMKKTLPAWKWYLRLPACPQALMSGRKWPEDRYRVYLYIVDRLTKPFDGRPINSHIYIVMYHPQPPSTPSRHTVLVS